MKSKLFVLVLVVVLTAFAATPIAAAPLATACAPGAAYNPTGDVNQDGAVNVLDVQLTAGHWNQTGTFTSDNSHNHLGQTWTGTNNPLTITGAYGLPLYAPLNLSNSAGVGLRITSADSSGIFIDSTSDNGMWVVSAANAGVRVEGAGHDGLFVCHTGALSTCNPNAYNNGVEIGNAQHMGVFVNAAGIDGVRVGSAGQNGVYVGSASNNGVDVAGANYGGYFVGNIFVTGNCIGCLQANFAVNAGQQTLEVGDVVSVQSVASTDFDAGATVWQVTQAQSGQTVGGVVAGRAELVTEEEHRPTESGRRLVPREGTAQPGEYVTIVYSGPMKVKVAPGESTITAGTRLTAAANGSVRQLSTMKVQLAGGQGTADMLESAPVIGVALEAAKDGMVWVLVNPQ